MTFHYKVYGEPLSSEIELDMLEASEPSAPAGGGWSFRIVVGREPEAIDWYHAIAGDDGDGVLRYGRAGEFHFVEIRGLPTVRIAAAAREIVAFAPVPVARETMTHVVVDQALPLAIAHSRRIVLHASCVVRDGVALAFVGPSGSGKSTLAAVFCRLGWQLVSDDALAFESISPPRVAPAYRSVRLWSDSLRWMGEHDRFLPRVAEGMDKRLLELPPSAGTQLVRRIYLVKPATSSATHSIRKPNLSETITSIASCSFRLDTRDRDFLAYEFDALFRLTEACPTSILEVARGFDRIASLVDLVEADAVDG